MIEQDKQVGGTGEMWKRKILCIPAQVAHERIAADERALLINFYALNDSEAEISSAIATLGGGREAKRGNIIMWNQMV